MYASGFRGYLSGVASLTATGTVTAASVVGTTGVFSGALSALWMLETTGIYPTVLANQNDWSPGGITLVNYIFAVPDAPRSITGLFTDYTQDRRYVLVNNSAFVLTLTHEDVLSTAESRFLLAGAANLAIPSHGAVHLVYHAGAVLRWRVTAKSF